MNAVDLVQYLVQRGGHQPVHRGWLVALDEVRVIAVATKQGIELGVRNAAQNGRVGDLVAVQVEDWQDRAVGSWVQKLVRMPGGRQGARFGFAITHDAGNQQVRVIERGAIRVRQ